MTSLEAKLLGEKSHNYCSSSEDEEEPGEQTPGGATSQPPPAEGGSNWQGYSQNTGPKGVLRDWELFKEHEKQARVAKEQELIDICTNNALTCRTEAEDERIQAIEKAAADELDEDIMSDEILKNFIQKRLDSMLKTQAPLEFGYLEEISSGEEYLKVIDDANEKVTIILHIHDPGSAECVKMNDCLTTVASMYRNVKFCKMKATVAGVSKLFTKEGVPALLVYKGGILIGNFIRLKDDFGSEFYPGDVENFLIENGILQDQTNLSALLKDKCNFKT